MKKILLAFECTSFYENAFNFALHCHRHQPVHLEGMFVSQADNAGLWKYATGMAGPGFAPFIEKDEAVLTKKNIRRFEQLCRQHHIEYEIASDIDDSLLSGLRNKTRFADLLILSSASFENSNVSPSADEFIKNVLHASECPVIVLPKQIDFPQKNVLAYDGSESSVYAIKQFAYLMPFLCQQETVLVYLNEGAEPFPFKQEIETLLQHHFKHSSLLELDVQTVDQFGLWMSENKNALLVSGSYGRSFLSEMIWKSFIHDVLKDQKVPLFITHC